MEVYIEDTNSIWLDVLDLENGSNLKIYEKGKEYYVAGHHHVIEIKNDNSWLSITAFYKANISNNIIIEDHRYDEKAFFVIRLKDIEHIEVFN